jgi:SNF2 family DNA or RNA helicase
LIVCPGSLAVQWQDELSPKFDLPFEILTNERIEAARIGSAYLKQRDRAEVKEKLNQAVSERREPDFGASSLKLKCKD